MITLVCLRTLTVIRWIDIGVEPLAEVLGEAMKMTGQELCQMGMNGRRLVEAKYAWLAITEQMKDAYTCLLNHDKLSEGGL